MSKEKSKGGRGIVAEDPYKRISVTISPEHDKALNAELTRLNVSKSEYISTLIEESLSPDKAKLARLESLTKLPTQLAIFSISATLESIHDDLSGKLSEIGTSDPEELALDIMKQALGNTIISLQVKSQRSSETKSERIGFKLDDNEQRAKIIQTIKEGIN